MRLFKKAASSRASLVHLNVTALVDVMTVLVIFLMMQFNASGEMLLVSPDLKMPEAKNGQDVGQTLLLSLDRKGNLYLGGRQIAIVILSRELGEARKKNPGPNAAQAINLQIDRSVDYGVLKRILSACEGVGYHQIRLSVANETH